MTRASTLALMALLASPAPGLAGGMAMGPNADPADRALMASMRSMQRRMAVKPTGNADRDFALMMMPHHQGAIDMAKVELRYGRDPMLRQLATGVVAAQAREIRAMKAWLARHR